MHVLISLVLLGAHAGLIAATPPNIPTAKTAQNELAGLTVAVQGLQDGYSRDKFPHWITQSGTCNTREIVLKRDGTDVVTNSACAATSGVWYSPYDGTTWMNVSDVDIDHVVPLSNAWKSGASSWTTSRRQAFANDLTNPQLITVTDNVNQAKGDQGPEEWQPSIKSYHCTYASMWIHVKYNYNLTIKSDEQTALLSMLNTCGNLTTTVIPNSTSNTTKTGASPTICRQYSGFGWGCVFIILTCYALLL